MRHGICVLILLEDALEDCKKQKITPKAIIVVHLYGMPAKMHDILSNCKSI